MLYPALPVMAQSQTQMFGPALEVEGEDKVSPPGLALPNQEDAVASDRLVKDHGCRVLPGQHPVEPGIV